MCHLYLGVRVESQAPTDVSDEVTYLVVIEVTSFQPSSGLRPYTGFGCLLSRLRNLVEEEVYQEQVYIRDANPIQLFRDSLQQPIEGAVFA